MSGSAVIGVVGNDLPRQLPLAAGALPVRLTGSWEGPIDPGAQELLGAADLETVRILSELRAGTAGLGGLIVCNDSQAHLRLFYVLRATAPQLRVHLLDLPRKDSRPARAFAHRQLVRVLRFCEETSGTRADAAGFAAAAEAERALGTALLRLRQTRRSDRARLPGTAAIDAWLQAGRRPPEEAAASVAAVCASADGRTAALSGPRVHLTGSNHPDASVYRALEAHGVVIVSEDHDTGDGAWIGVAVDGDETEGIADALVAAHFARTGGSATATSAQRAHETAKVAVEAGAEVVGALIRDLDDAPRWDLADQARVLEGAGLTLHARTRIGADPYSDAAELAAALRGR